MRPKERLLTIVNDRGKEIERIEYNDNVFDSDWEFEFVKFLDAHNIKWIRKISPFIYIYKNSEHRYFPDLYLPDHDLYIEIKGRCTEKDKAKLFSCKYDFLS